MKGGPALACDRCVVENGKKNISVNNPHSGAITCFNEVLPKLNSLHIHTVVFTLQAVPMSPGHKYIDKN